MLPFFYYGIKVQTFFFDYWNSEAPCRSGIQIRKSKSGHQTLAQKRASSCVSSTQ